MEISQFFLLLLLLLLLLPSFLPSSVMGEWGRPKSAAQKEAPPQNERPNKVCFILLSMFVEMRLSSHTLAIFLPLSCFSSAQKDTKRLQRFLGALEEVFLLSRSIWFTYLYLCSSIFHQLKREHVRESTFSTCFGHGLGTNVNCAHEDTTGWITSFAPMFPARVAKGQRRSGLPRVMQIVSAELPRPPWRSREDRVATAHSFQLSYSIPVSYCEWNDKGPVVQCLGYNCCHTRDGDFCAASATLLFNVRSPIKSENSGNVPW